MNDNGRPVVFVQAGRSWYNLSNVISMCPSEGNTKGYLYTLDHGEYGVSIEEYRQIEAALAHKMPVRMATEQEISDYDRGIAAQGELQQVERVLEEGGITGHFKNTADAVQQTIAELRRLEKIVGVPQPETVDWQRRVADLLGQVERLRAAVYMAAHSRYGAFGSEDDVRRKLLAVLNEEGAS